MSDATVYARGFAEGIEAVAKWHQAVAMRLVVIAEADWRDGCFEQGTEALNRACDHALCIPAIRALAPARQRQDAG
jgi:hypothetical protein